MSVCSQNNNSKQTCREIPGFISKVKKKKSWNYTHFIWHSVSLSWYAFHTISNQRNSQTADVKDPWWSPWKDQKDLGLVYQQLSSLQRRLNGLDGIPAAGGALSSTQSYLDCTKQVSSVALNPAECWSYILPTQLWSHLQFPSPFRLRKQCDFALLFYLFQLKIANAASNIFFFPTVFPSFLSLSLLYFFRLFCFSGKAHSFIISVPTRIWSKTIVSELQLYCTQDL